MGAMVSTKVLAAYLGPIIEGAGRRAPGQAMRLNMPRADLAVSFDLFCQAVDPAMLPNPPIMLAPTRPPCLPPSKRQRRLPYRPWIS